MLWAATPIAAMPDQTGIGVPVYLECGRRPALGTGVSTWVMVYRVAWGVLVILIVVGLVCVFAPKCQMLRSLQQKKLELQAENRARAEQIRDLREKEQRFLTDPEFVRRTAHESGRVAPDEIIFTYPTNANDVQRK